MKPRHLVFVGRSGKRLALNDYVSYSTGLELVNYFQVYTKYIFSFLNKLLKKAIIFAFQNIVYCLQ